MSMIRFAVVTTPPGADDHGLVSSGGATRRAYFSPQRWGGAGKLPVAVAGTRVAVQAGGTGCTALWPVAATTPTATPGGGWS